MTTVAWLVAFPFGVGILGVILDRIIYGNWIWWSEDD